MNKGEKFAKKHKNNNYNCIFYDNHWNNSL